MAFSCLDPICQVWPLLVTLLIGPTSPWSMKQGAFLAQKWLKFWRFGLVIFPVFLLPGGSREGSPGGPAGNLQTTQKCLIFKVVFWGTQPAAAGAGTPCVWGPRRVKLRGFWGWCARALTSKNYCRTHSPAILIRSLITP